MPNYNSCPRYLSLIHICAGISAESGISTFRDAGGLWDQYPVEQVATPEGYAAVSYTHLGDC